MTRWRRTIAAFLFGFVTDLLAASCVLLLLLVAAGVAGVAATGQRRE